MHNSPKMSDLPQNALPATNWWQQRFIHQIALVVVFFCFYAPTLPWIHFRDGMENFNVLPAVEIARDGAWVVPTLWGHPRLEKPPLVQWITALGILAGGPTEFAARWPSLLMACLMLVIVYEWGRMLGDWRTGLVAAIFAGSSLFFIRFGKRAAYDVQLAFWVALTNLCLTWALWRGHWWKGGIAAGLALGGAMMSKGPPGMLHTIAPFAVCCIAMGIWKLRQSEAHAWKWLARAMAVVAMAAVISILVGLPWVLALASRVGGIRMLLTIWRGEIVLSGEQVEKLYTSPLTGFVFLALILPWTGWFIGAAVVAWRRWREKGPVLAYLCVMTVLPVVVHSFAPLVRDRYLVPMLSAAAVAAAIVYMDMASRFDKRTSQDRLGEWVHWLCLGGIVVAYPIGSALSAGNLSQDPGQTPLSWPVAITLAGVGLALVVAGILWQRKSPVGLVVGTLVAMLYFQGVYGFVQNNAPDPLRQVADKIRRTWPDAKIYGYIADLPTKAPPYNASPPRALAIYLDQTVRTVFSVREIPRRHGRVMILIREEPTEKMPQGSVRRMVFHDEKWNWALWELPYSR